MRERPLVIAHRGSSWDEPENTLPAFERAIADGADYVEFDVRAARDGTLIVAHDPVRGERPPGVPTLAETLDALRGRIGLAVEIKEQATTRRVLEALRAHALDAEAVMILSFRIRALEQVRRARPDLRLVLHLWRRPDPAAASRFWGVGFPDRAARPQRLRLAQGLGLETTVFTVNDPARMRELADLGVGGIFTDRPALLREVVGG